MFVALTESTTPTDGAAFTNGIAGTAALTASAVVTPAVTGSAFLVSAISPECAATAADAASAPPRAITPQASAAKSQSLRTPAATPAPRTPKPTATPAAGKEFRQAIVVIASGYKAKVSLYERTSAGWELVLETSGCVGRSGLTSNKKEGDMKTPKGVFGLSFAFGSDKPETAMPFREITGDSYWVDDPESEYYNTWQEGYKGWNSAEKLSDHPESYRYAVAVAYNTARTPGRGSAIFLHCKTRAYTSGCIAVPQATMIELLKKLDPAKNPVILIGGSVKSIESYGILKLP